MRRFFRSLFVFLATLVILFEEWLWEPLKRLMLAFARLPLIRQLSAAIASLSPRSALLVFLVPVLVLFPFKIGGLWLIANGHPGWGVLVFLGAKVTGTALFAWLFELTRNTLLQIGWFARIYGWVQQVSQAAHAWMHRQPLYHLIRDMVIRLKAQVRQWLARFRA